MIARRRHGLAFVAAALALALLQACAPAPPATSDASLPAVPPTSPVEGVVVSVTSTGLDNVTGFTLRVNGGALYRFGIGVLENGAVFPPGHLTEHQANSEPVRVAFVVRGGAAVAVRIEDAGAPAPT